MESSHSHEEAIKRIKEISGTPETLKQIKWVEDNAEGILKFLDNLAPLIKDSNSCFQINFLDCCPGREEEAILTLRCLDPELIGADDRIIHMRLHKRNNELFLSINHDGDVRRIPNDLHIQGIAKEHSEKGYAQILFEIMMSAEFIISQKYQQNLSHSQEDYNEKVSDINQRYQYLTTIDEDKLTIKEKLKIEQDKLKKKKELADAKKEYTKDNEYYKNVYDKLNECIKKIREKITAKLNNVEPMMNTKSVNKSNEKNK